MFGFKAKKQGNRKVEPVKNLKERAKNRNIKPFVIASLICVCVVSIVAVHNQLKDKILFPINEVLVANTLNHVDAEVLKDIVLNEQEQGFFDIELNQLANQIEEINWVAQATLRRVWPNKVEVLVREHQAAAIWNDTTLISTNGILFNVENSKTYQLPVVNGQTDKAKSLLLAQSELDQLVNQYGLQVTQLKSIKSGEVKVNFNTGLAVVFALQDKAIQFKRFQSLLDTKYLNVAKNTLNKKAVISLDMRYSNGFSVVWQEPQSNLIKQANQLGNGRNHV